MCMYGLVYVCEFIYAHIMLLCVHVCVCVCSKINPTVAMQRLRTSALEFVKLFKFCW